MPILVSRNISIFLVTNEQLHSMQHVSPHHLVDELYCTVYYHDSSDLVAKLNLMFRLHGYCSLEVDRKHFRLL